MRPGGFLRLRRGPGRVVRHPVAFQGLYADCQVVFEACKTLREGHLLGAVWGLPVTGEAVLDLEIAGFLYAVAPAVYGRVAHAKAFRNASFRACELAFLLDPSAEVHSGFLWWK